jgi:hypothetical protein
VHISNPNPFQTTQQKQTKFAHLLQQEVEELCLLFYCFVFYFPELSIEKSLFGNGKHKISSTFLDSKSKTGNSKLHFLQKNVQFWLATVDLSMSICRLEMGTPSKSHSKSIL